MPGELRRTSRIGKEENSKTALMAGHAKFHIYLTPPSPLCLLEYVLEYDVSYLSSLMAG